MSGWGLVLNTWGTYLEVIGYKLIKHWNGLTEKVGLHIFALEKSPSSGTEKVGRARDMLSRPFPFLLIHG
jgi:hypothetical protein